MITQEQLKNDLAYDPETGIFTWKINNNVVGPGVEAGYVDKYGYRTICIRRKNYRAARLVWLYVYGRWPAQYIDHKDGNRDNNRLNNLREASKSENNRNHPKRLGCEFTLKGVSKYTWKNKSKINLRYRAKIKVGGKDMYLGYFDTQEEAHAAYCEAAKKYFGEFARFK